MLQSLKKVNRWPAWKHWLFVIGIFALGVLIGRLLIDRWQLIAGIAVVIGGMTILLASERRGKK